MVDTVLVTLLCLAVLPFTAFAGLFFFPALLLVVGFACRVASIARSSATPGMRLAAIELRTLRGERLDLPLAFWHTLVFTIACAVFVIQAASIVLMLTGARGQGLPDHLLGTVALNRAAAG